VWRFKKVERSTYRIRFNPNCPLVISLLVGASLLANLTNIFASKLAPTMGFQSNELIGFNAASGIADLHKSLSEQSATL
jgi:hypothetical protein